MKNPSMGFIAGLAVLSVQSVSPSIAATTIGQVALGTDYFQTTFTVIDFGGSIGSINLTGNPIGPGNNTDTIIQRQADANIGGPQLRPN